MAAAGWRHLSSVGHALARGREETVESPCGSSSGGKRALHTGASARCPPAPPRRHLAC
eukprot:COSAG06_NODE_14_length_35011_cov_20.984132_11_plen_58_part_00